MISALLLAAALQVSQADAQTTPTSLFQDVPLPEGHVHESVSLVRVLGSGRALLRLQRLDLDVIRKDLAGGEVVAIVDEADIEAIEALQLEVEVEVPDLAAYYARRLAAGSAGGSSRAAGGTYGQSLNPAFGQGGMGGYYTFAEIVGVIDQLRASYPNLVSQKTSIGQSVQGRDIWMFKVSDNPSVDEDEPEFRVDSLHHAREPQGMQTTIYFVSWLLEEYGSDPLATYLVDEREIYVVLCVNPDGYEYNRSIAPGGGGLWRKNRRNNGGGVFGVDLNRNYPFQWAVAGSSSNPDSDIYHGPSAASEPETQAIVQLMGQRSFRSALSVHTFSDLWLSPWGYVPQFPPDWDEMEVIGDLAVTETGYPHGPASILLYEAAGTTMDHDYGANGTYSWTPEIGSDSDGFWPPQSRIVPLAEDNRLAFARTALAAGPWLRGEAVALADLGDGDGSFEAGEQIGVTVTIGNSGRSASGAASLTLTSGDPGLQVIDGSASLPAVAPFTSGQNTAALTLAVAAGTPSGAILPFTVTVTEAGRSFELSGELTAGVRTVASFDFEASGNQGWSVAAPNDASTGNWEVGDPVGTTAQPENDNTPGAGTRCWFTGQGSVGGGLGANDVDGGRTTLLSPVFDLDGAISGTLSFARWYSNDAGASPNADVFEVDLSADGGATWTNALTVGPAGAGTSGGWIETTVDIGASIPLTADVRVRFIASDLGSGSIVEAAIDDVAVFAVDPPTCPPPANYCVGGVNGFGTSATMAASGSQDVDDQDLTLGVFGAAPSQFGLFFYGPSQASTPLGNGTLCVGGNINRLPVIGTGPFGGAQQPLGFGSLPAPIANGDVWNFQFWYRDIVGSGSNLSDGLQITFCAAP